MDLIAKWRSQREESLNLLIDEQKIIQPEEQKEKYITEPLGPLGHYYKIKVM